jgi:diguanylate cyclase (GGDEF)-like protein/putative nucleotidyltransferase with HDIG domain
MGSRVDRLAAYLRSSPDAERVVAGRVGGALWLVAALATISLPLFPQVTTPLWPWPALWTIGALTWGLCACLVIDWRVAPSWALPTAAVAAVVVVAAITQLTGGAGSPARLYIFFVLIYVACFLGAREAIGIVAACAAVWALPDIGDRGWPTAVGELAMALPIFAVLGAILLVGRRLLGAMHDGAQRLSDEHHALREIATAVAAGRPPEVVCSLAAEQAALLLEVQGGGILRFDPDDHLTVLGSFQRHGTRVTPGMRFPIVGESPIAQIRRTASAVRIDDFSQVGYDARTMRDADVDALVGTPVFVRGRLWGALVVTAERAHGLPDDAEAHLAEFAELIGMAVANTEEVARLEADATTDPLTGLANHRAFQERLRAEVARAARHDRPVALALVDVDHFKAVNDAGGHALGDEVLRAVAAHLREHLRAEDLLARVGGDEFAILLPEAGAGDAAAALERARRTIAAAPFPGGAHLTISVGICDATHAAGDAEALSRFADGALYWSKEHGRNRVSAYDPATIHELSADERIGQLQRSQALTGIRALARAIDARDPSTREHSERVARLAARLAEERGWPAERVALLHEAALVHDVGKIGIPDAILLKPSRLTAEEYEVIKTHAELGARMVEEILNPEQVEWVRGHHERPDGRGYPRGLVAEELSEGAALLAAADAFDVMVSARPYSPGRSVDEALAEVRALRGAQFADAAVDALEAAHAAPAAPLAEAA